MGQYANPNLVFVDFRPKSVQVEQAYPNATFVQRDILDYLDGDESIPKDGFDVIIMRNVLSGARQRVQGNPNLILQQIGHIVAQNGLLIIDETLDATDMLYGQATKAVLEKAGFTVSLSNDPSDYHDLSEYHEDAFHIEARKR
ncbi:MAG: methyltransferase domain-containing protein [Candidatus Gottesmanbacteria bacterium]|nr:methyltransferase domain-containing protein [Candidatus Gottesmanbacteria bacterium]